MEGAEDWIQDCVEDESEMNAALEELKAFKEKYILRAAHKSDDDFKREVRKGDVDVCELLLEVFKEGTISNPSKLHYIQGEDDESSWIVIVEEK